MMDVFDQAAGKIIKEQEGIIGPLALEQARKVTGLKLGDDNQVTLVGNKSEVLDKLIQQYEKLFGRTSVEVCKEAAADLMSQLKPQQIPRLLQ